MRGLSKPVALMAAAIALFAGHALAGDEGTSGGVTLTFPSGARALAMAEAYTVSASDPSGLYYNPASIAPLEGPAASVFYGRGFFDDQYGALTYVRPAGPGVMGAGLKYYTTGEMDLDNGETVRTARGLSDYSLGLSYAASIGPGVGLGGTVKILRSSLIEDFSATSVALDAGLTYRVGGSGLIIGASLTNLGSGLKYRDVAAPLPWAVGLGALYRGVYLKAPASAAADILKTREGGLKGRLGLEARPGGLVAVRVGYKFGYDSDSFTVGLGLRVNNLDFNYAAGIASELSNLHLFEVTYRFH